MQGILKEKAWKLKNPIGFCNTWWYTFFAEKYTSLFKSQNVQKKGLQKRHFYKIQNPQRETF